MANQVTYKNVAISVNGTGLMCSSATIGNSKSYQSLVGLGKKNNAYSFQTDRATSNVSVEFVSNVSLLGLTGNVPANLVVAGVSGSAGRMTSYGINVPARGLITSSASFDFYKPISGNVSSGLANYNSQLFPQASFSRYTGLGFNDSAVSISIQYSQGFDNDYKLGTVSDILSVERTESSVTVSIEGTGLGLYLSQPCQDVFMFSFTGKDLCGNSIFAINLDKLKAVSSELSINTDSQLIGKAEFIKYF